ncbi:tripartite tricarboxylate transporter TctB family protein [Pelobacter seleniigenes]|uniref:tripartite tricarboxylate transporter TctB family protein n=1 Tax=Pelobacter seleniigenes TaxID=407188 RepID=UPI0004A6D60D|nr:tripartite tricarboxylate transporter TctB family protein [Pelobacter seleniigenes]
MDSGQSSIFQVSVDFSTSHLLFPKLVIYFLLFLLMLIFIIYGIPKLKRIIKGEENFKFSMQHIDKFRFFGTILLTVVYFVLMDYVGQFFPNTGMGFLLISIPFILLLSLLYSHQITKSRLLVIVLNAVLAPCIAWYVLEQLFNISLP